MVKDLILQEFTNADGSKHSSVKICGRILIQCDSRKDAEDLYVFLLKYRSGIRDMVEY